MKNWQVETLNSQINEKLDQLSNYKKECELNTKLQLLEKSKEVEIVETKFNNLIKDFNYLAMAIDSNTKEFSDNLLMNKNIANSLEKVVNLQKEVEMLNKQNVLLFSFIENFIYFFSKLNEYLIVNNPSNTLNNTLIGLNSINKNFINSLNEDFTLNDKDFNVKIFLEENNSNLSFEKFKDIPFSSNSNLLLKIKTKLIFYQRKIFELIKKANLVLNSHNNKVK
jgi:hypothetical protein